jgi:hypothetical protein
VGLELGPLSLVRITEELFEWKSSGSGQENRINGRGDPLCWTRDTLYPQQLALTSPTSGRSVGIVHLRIEGHGVYFSFLVNTTESKLANSHSPLEKKATWQQELIGPIKGLRMDRK